MSFILDALKKSETDRQRQGGPSLFEVKIAPPRRALPVWAVAIAVLLGINIIVVSWMLLRHPAAQQPASASNAPAAAPPTARVTASAGEAAAQAVQGAPAPGAADATSNGRSPPAEAVNPPGSAAAGTGAASSAALRGETASAGTAETAGTTAPAAAERAAALNPRSVAASPASDAGTRNAEASAADPSDLAPAVQPAAGAAASGEAAGDLPLYQQIVASAGLPSLHLDLHVFADRPQDRFVMINMHRLGEGSSLPNGVQVKAIRPDGAVLSYRGTRFLLPRN